MKLKKIRSSIIHLCPPPGKLFLRHAWLIVCFSVATLGILSPQSMGQTGTTARVTGTVTDPSGAVLPGATITIREADTNATRTITTAENGDYAVTQLTPGKYSLTVEKQGFGSYQQNDIVLVIGQVAEINVQLQVGSQAQKVTVTSSAPVIQTEDSYIGSVIDSQTIVNTPLNGRLSSMGLVALAPGVQGAGAQDQRPGAGGDGRGDRRLPLP